MASRDPREREATRVSVWIVFLKNFPTDLSVSYSAGGNYHVWIVISRSSCTQVHLEEESRERLDRAAAGVRERRPATI